MSKYGHDAEDRPTNLPTQFTQLLSTPVATVGPGYHGKKFLQCTTTITSHFMNYIENKVTV